MTKEETQKLEKEVHQVNYEFNTVYALNDFIRIATRLNGTENVSYKEVLFEINEARETLSKNYYTSEDDTTDEHVY